MNRRTFLRRALTGTAALAFAGRGLANIAKRRPNIIFILADDLGWRDTSLYGSSFCQTPNIDSLARRGMMFTNAYAANPLCSPTRASIMTGLYPARIGITSPACHLKDVVFVQSLQEKASPARKVLAANSVTRLKQEYFTLAEALKQAGYTTGHFGKWHLGHEPYDPLHHGFDADKPHWPGPGPAGSYLAPWRFGPQQTVDQGQPGEHIEDRMATEAIEFIKSNKDRPFFVNYWAFSVHAPHIAKPELVEAYKTRADADNPQHHPVYGAMVQSLDENVGLLIKTIDELGLADNTIIIFFSDNGGIHWPSKQCYPDLPVTSNSPLKGGKATIYEGGTREPCIIIWPGVVQPGSKSDEIISSIDFYPTILEMLDLKPQPGQEFDGISIVPALKARSLARDTIFCHFPHGAGIRPGFQPATSVRQGDWKLIRFYCDNDDQTDRFELYNLKNDIGETKDLADEYPLRVRLLSALINEFLRNTGAIVPKPNPNYRPARKR